MNTNGLINSGNSNRIKNAMMRARHGQKTTVAFMGGSITQGSVSSRPELSYTALIHKWWVERFPEAEIVYLNVGIGATDSRYGAARVKEHVLGKRPDFLLVEFSVNDENEPEYMESMEGLVRMVLKDDSKPGLMILANVWYDTGKSAEDMHLPVAVHYDVPFVSIKSTIFEAIKTGELDKNSVSEDMLHPNDRGHRLLADVVINYLESIYREVMSTISEECALDMTMPDPVTSNRFEDSRIIKGGCTGIGLDGFVPDQRPKKEFLDIFSEGFIGRKTGDSIELTAECSGIFVQYRRTINKPAPLVMVTVDGDLRNGVILDGNFDEDWGDKLCLTEIAGNMSFGLHKVKVRVVEAHDDDKEPFYLGAFIVTG